MLRSSGVPDYVVQHLSGHKSTKMLENYSHVENFIDFEAARTKMAETIRTAIVAGEKTPAPRLQRRITGALHP